MLTQRQIVDHLQQRKFIDAKSIVEGDLAVSNASRRNNNFKIASKRGPSYFIKQGSDPNTIETLRHEAAVYKFFQSDVEDNGLKNYLPRSYGYDEKRKLLILELLPDARSLRECHARYRRFPESIAESLADALSAFHKFARNGEQHTPNSLFQPRMPRTLSIHLPDNRRFVNSSAANIELIDIIRQFPEFCEALDNLRREWKSETVIHNDIKWDNCLLETSRNPKRKASLKIVDWELSSLGDPGWDIGSAFSDYLSFWLFSIPITGEAPPDRFAELARYPLSRMLPAFRRLWFTYAERMGYDSKARRERLIRAVKYAAARLIQTCSEHMQGSMKMTGNAVCLLQLSMNIMLRPMEAAVQLLGIPLS